MYAWKIQTERLNLSYTVSMKHTHTHTLDLLGGGERQKCHSVGITWNTEYKPQALFNISPPNTSEM